LVPVCIAKIALVEDAVSKVRRPMRRQATSPEELAQLARVHGLLCNIDVFRSPHLAVTVATGKTLTGQFLRLHERNMPAKTKKGLLASEGEITLATQDGELEINYLDIVSLQTVQRPR
jgi:hypothetical protein